MARCKCCHNKGFMVETDANGLCSACAPYYYLSMGDDLKALEQSLQALNRISRPEAALGRLEKARISLDNLRPYILAGLVKLPQPLDDLDRWLDQQIDYWREVLS